MIGALVSLVLWVMVIGVYLLVAFTVLYTAWCLLQTFFMILNGLYLAIVANPTASPKQNTDVAFGLIGLIYSVVLIAIAYQLDGLLLWRIGGAAVVWLIGITLMSEYLHSQLLKYYTQKATHLV